VSALQEEAAARVAAARSAALGAFERGKDTARRSLSLLGNAAACQLVSSLPAAPATVRRDASLAAQRDVRLAATLALFSGEESKLEEAWAFYADGFALLSHDVRRDRQQPGSWRQKRLSGDLRALVPFSVLLMQTVPFTHVVLDLPPLKPGGWVPRRWVLPTAFENRRLRAFGRARRAAERRKV